MTRTEAARTIALEGQRHTLVAYFTKRTTGEERRMVLRYGGDPIRGGLVRVWDLEKGAYRTVNLDGVRAIKVLIAPPRPQDRPAEPPKRDASRARLDELRAEMDRLFY